MSKAVNKAMKKSSGDDGQKEWESSTDRYKQVSQEFDADFNSEKTANGYHNADESNIYNKFEDKDIGTPLDGEALTKEIGGTVLTKELYDRNVGAGFKDKSDLADLLSSIKGAATFMNHTPKEQL